MTMILSINNVTLVLDTSVLWDQPTEDTCGYYKRIISSMN